MRFVFSRSLYVNMVGVRANITSNKAGGVVSLTVFFFFETWLASKYFGDLRHEMKWDI